MLISFSKWESMKVCREHPAGNAGTSCTVTSFQGGIWFLGCKRKELGCTKFPSCFLFGPDSLNSLNV